MFKKELRSNLEKIFGFQKSTLSDPSPAFEQDTLFIEITESVTRISQNKETAKVAGYLTVYSQDNKLPYGYFNKRIEQADLDLTKDFFFFNIDVNAANSSARFQNIHERRVDFVYLYSGQYDPNQGELTSVVFGG